MYHRRVGPRRPCYVRGFAFSSPLVGWSCRDRIRAQMPRKAEATSCSANLYSLRPRTLSGAQLMFRITRFFLLRHVEHPLSGKERGGATVADRGDLAGLALAVVERGRAHYLRVWWCQFG